MITIEELKKQFITNGRVKFKLYTLDYEIIQNDAQVIIYSLQYPNNKTSFNSFDEVINNYLIYNESIIENEDKIIKL